MATKATLPDKIWRATAKHRRRKPHPLNVKKKRGPKEKHA
jgi:hypothetical protein